MWEMIVIYFASAVILIIGLDQLRFGYLLRKRPATLRRWDVYIVLGILMIMSAIAEGIYIWYTDVSERELRERASQLEYKLEGFRQYGNIAKYNAFGLTGLAAPGSGLKENSPIADALEGAYIEIEGKGGLRSYPRCDAQGINMFANVVRDFPDFPFGYWALAVCFSEESNPQWRTHAERAKEIFEHTTKIAGHKPQHDEALQEIERLLAEQ